MIESASGRLPNYPDHPPAASVGLGSLAPDLFLAFGSRLTSASRSSLVEENDPLLRHEVEGVDGLSSLGYQTATSESLNRTSSTTLRGGAAHGVGPRSRAASC